VIRLFFAPSRLCGPIGRDAQHDVFVGRGPPLFFFFSDFGSRMLVTAIFHAGPFGRVGWSAQRRNPSRPTTLAGGIRRRPSGFLSGGFLGSIDHGESDVMRGRNRRRRKPHLAKGFERAVEFDFGLACRSDRIRFPAIDGQQLPALVFEFFRRTNATSDAAFLFSSPVHPHGSIVSRVWFVRVTKIVRSGCGAVLVTDGRTSQRVCRYCRRNRRGERPPDRECQNAFPCGRRTSISPVFPLRWSERRLSVRRRDGEGESSGSGVLAGGCLAWRACPIPPANHG